MVTSFEGSNPSPSANSLENKEKFVDDARRALAFDVSKSLSRRQHTGNMMTQPQRQAIRGALITRKKTTQVLSDCGNAEIRMLRRAASAILLDMEIRRACRARH